MVGKGLADGNVEVKDRASGEREDVPADHVVDHLVLVRLVPQLTAMARISLPGSRPGSRRPKPRPRSSARDSVEISGFTGAGYPKAVPGALARRMLGGARAR